MRENLKLTDTLALGFMTFAFFLGAGNIIFPPLAGFLAGEQSIPAMLGFLMTAVGLPLIGIVAIAISGGWEGLTRPLPKIAATTIAVLIFIIIGPAFAIPRAGLVAYEIGVKPFLFEPSQLELIIFSAVFFAVASFFALNQGKLIDTIGKMLTPALLFCLVVLAIAVVMNPQGSIGLAQGEYLTQPFTKGFLEGYNTMDTFGALMFGMLIVDMIHKKGVTSEAQTRKYLIIAGIIAAIGLAFVYISLFVLGATATGVATDASNGSAILISYVQALFGPVGLVILASIILLACLTTVIGLLSACSEYFESITKINYRSWVIILAAISAVVSNVGLTQLIAISVPVLFALYPVAIALIVLAFIGKFYANQALTYSVVIGISLLFALLDAAKVVGLDVSMFDYLPLFDYGMAWLLPMLMTLVITKFVGKPQKDIANA